MSLSVGSPLPEFGGLKYIKGDPLVREPGKVLVLEFWATWCPPCVKSIPHVSQIQQKFKDRNVQIVGITSENESAVRPFVENMGKQMEYTVAIDAQNEARQKIMQPLGIRGIPHAVVVDKHGFIIYAGHPMEAEFEQKIEKAVNDDSTSPKAPQRELPRIRESREELSSKTIRQLKAILTERKISTVGLAEKSDLVDKILETCVNITYYADAEQ